MIIIPAVDIKDGCCVRLRQGVMEDQTVYSREPVSAALSWEQQGAELLHVVDLDGAVSGNPVNLEPIRQILQTVKIPVQVGGGLRDLEAMESYLAIGASRVVLGTAAVRNPDLLQEACSRFPGRIVVAIDSRDGRVAVEGWQEVSEQSSMELIKELEKVSPAALLVTDIRRDGMLTGPNLPALRAVLEATPIPVIASGGVSSLKDIEDLLSIRGLYGAVIGKALYEGRLKLREAVGLTRNQDKSSGD